MDIRTSLRMPNQENVGSFIRWQSYSLNQLSYAINLFLSLTIASIGFQTSMLLDGKYDQDSCIALFSLAFLFASGCFGVWSVLNRLWSFHETAQAARAREQERSQDHARHKAQYEKCDSWTWPLFYIQVAGFGLGI